VPDGGISEPIWRAARLRGDHDARRCRTCGRPLYGRGKVCRSRRCPEYGPVWAGDQRQKLFRNLEVLEGTILLSAVTAPGADALPWDEHVCAGFGEHDHSGQLAHAGKARDLALHGAEEQLDRIARLLPDALGGGISLTEISRVTGVSRPTLYELRARYGGSVGDLRLAILQAAITANAVTPDQLVERLSRSITEIKPVVDDFLAGELLDVHHEQVGEDRWEEQLHLTEKGLVFLEHWRFEADGGEVGPDDD
jgi:hypothetical protein